MPARKSVAKKSGAKSTAKTGKKSTAKTDAKKSVLKKSGAKKLSKSASKSLAKSAKTGRYGAKSSDAKLRGAAALVDAPRRARRHAVERSAAATSLLDVPPGTEPRVRRETIIVERATIERGADTPPPGRPESAQPTVHIYEAEPDRDLALARLESFIEEQAASLSRLRGTIPRQAPGALKMLRESAELVLSDVDLERLRDLGRLLRGATEATISIGQRTAAVPVDLLTALGRMVATLERGAAVTLIESDDLSDALEPLQMEPLQMDLDHEVTSQVAADLLNVSRPHVVKLAQQGVLPHRKVGNRHRFRLGDVLAYDTQMSSVRDQALRDIAPEGGYTVEDF